MAEIKNYPNNRDEFVGAETLMKFLHGRTSGVYAADGNAAVTAVQDRMAVNVSDGYGWIADADKNGCVWWIENEKTDGSKLELGIDAADGTLNRIDRVIVEWTTTLYKQLPVARVLKGTLSSNPQPPALTNNAITRQISLARVSVPAGTTKIIPSLITDERLDKSVCGLVSNDGEIDTTVAQAQLEALLKAYEDALAAAEGGTAFELKRLQFTDTVVQPAAFVADSTYPDFPFRAAVALDGVLTTMTPEVVLGVSEAMSGNFAPVAETYTGGIYLYAASAPEAEITIPTIIAWKAVGA